jgi:hypothetical protein
MNWGRFAVLAGTAALLLTIAGSFGAASAPADTVEACAGKPLCVAITDQAQASRTPTGGPDHYLADTVTVRNSGTTSNLTNLALTITWTDNGAATTTAYRPAFSSSDCTASETATNTLTCTMPRSLGPNASVSFELVFRTATNVAATSFTLTATTTAKEQAKPSKGGQPPNDAVATTSNTTTYEGDLDQDVSIGGGGITTTIATAAGNNNQSSSLLIPAGAPRDLYIIAETNCPAGFTTCIGQSVTTTAVGLSPVNLQIVYEGALPNGTNENGIEVRHTPDGATEATVIDDNCSGALFSGTVDPDEIPCRRVDITKLSSGNEPEVFRVEVDAWDLENGGWDFG